MNRCLHTRSVDFLPVACGESVRSQTQLVPGVAEGRIDREELSAHVPFWKPRARSPPVDLDFGPRSSYTRGSTCTMFALSG